MSARALLALVCACAAVHAAAGVAHCSTLMLGRKTNDTIQLPTKTTGSHAYVYLPDECALQNKTLVGEEVDSCDTVGYFAPTAIPFGAGSFSPLYVNCAQQNEPCYELLTVTTTQYCEQRKGPHVALYVTGGKNLNALEYILVDP